MTDHIASRLTALDAKVDQTYRAFIRHTYRCEHCRTRGVDCPDAAKLKLLYRAAKTAALPVNEPVFGEDAKALGEALRQSLRKP